MNERNFFVVEKNRLIPLRQYEATLNRLSPLRYWLNHLRYKHNVQYATRKIQEALKKGLPVCFVEYRRIKPDEVKDVIARLNYFGYKVYSVYIPYGTSLMASFWVRFDDAKGIDYVSY